LNLPKSKINLECLKSWWNFEINKEVQNVINNAILDDMHIAELEPLGLNENICMILEKNYIHSVKDLMLLDFNNLSKIENIGIKNLFKILNALKNLHKLDELKETYLKSIANIDEAITIKYDFFSIIK
jgi:DNA-directed RNA polymerase alpha subunit